MYRQGICGRRVKNTSGTAAKRKRSATSANGGISRRPILMGTNEKPHSATMQIVSAKSRGVSSAFSERAPENSEPDRRRQVLRHQVFIERLQLGKLGPVGILGIEVVRVELLHP